MSHINANPVVSRSCNCQFESKGYERSAFFCQVCKVDDFDTERYRCDRCDGARHKGCIELADNLVVGPGPDNILGTGTVFELHRLPLQGSDSINKSWAKFCLVCGMAVELYSYYTRSDNMMDLNMHPCCAELANLGSLFHGELVLQTSEKHNCLLCGKKRPEGASQDDRVKAYCWSYKLDASGKHRIHVHCFREAVIRAMKSINYDDDGNSHVSIMLKRKRDNHSKEWEGVLNKALGIALDASGVGLTQIMLVWLLG